MLAYANCGQLHASQADLTKANQQLPELAQGSPEHEALLQRIQQLEREIELRRLEKSLFIIERRRRDDGDREAVRRAYTEWEAKKLQPAAFIEKIEKARFSVTPKAKQMAYGSGGATFQSLIKLLELAKIDECPVTAVYYIVDGAVFRAPGNRCGPRAVLPFRLIAPPWLQVPTL